MSEEKQGEGVAKRASSIADSASAFGSRKASFLERDSDARASRTIDLKKDMKKGFAHKKVICEKCNEKESVGTVTTEMYGEQDLCAECKALLEKDVEVLQQGQDVEKLHWLVKSKWIMDEMLEASNLAEQVIFFFLFNSRITDETEFNDLFQNLFIAFLIIDMMMTVAKMITIPWLHVTLHFLVELAQISSYVFLAMTKPKEGDSVFNTNGFLTNYQGEEGRLDYLFIATCAGCLGLQSILILVMSVAELCFREHKLKGKLKRVLIGILFKSLIFGIFFVALNVFSILLLEVNNSDIFNALWFQFFQTAVLFASGYLMEMTLYLLADSFAAYARKRRLKKQLTGSKSFVRVISKSFAAGRMSQAEYLFRRVKTLVCLIIYVGFLGLVFVITFLQITGVADEGSDPLDDPVMIAVICLYFFAFLCIGLFIFQICRSQTLRNEAKRMVQLKMDSKEVDHIRSVFKRYDKDGDGTISPQEFALLAKELMNRDLSPEELTAALAEIDENGDGEIEFDEFKNWWVIDIGATEEGQRLAANIEELAKAKNVSSKRAMWEKAASGKSIKEEEEEEEAVVGAAAAVEVAATTTTATTATPAEGGGDEGEHRHGSSIQSNRTKKQLKKEEKERKNAERAESKRLLKEAKELEKKNSTKRMKSSTRGGEGEGEGDGAAPPLPPDDENKPSL